ncbi:MAG: PilZ domain-containing protein [Planctomycetota bacterium]
MGQEPDVNEAEVDPWELLQAACDRNMPLEVVRKELAGAEPLARGRLLSIDDECITVEDLQVIGRKVRLTSSADVQAFFVSQDQVFHFVTVIKSMSQPFDLNGTFTIRSAELYKPKKIAKVQRRNAFRASAALFDTQIPLRIWRLRTPDDHPWVLTNPQDGSKPEKSAESNEGVETEAAKTEDLDSYMPKDQEIRDTVETQFHALGSVGDLSDTGIGILVEMQGMKRFSIYELLLLSIDLPEEEEPVLAMGEIRRITRLPNKRVKLGLLFQDLPAETTRAFTKFARELQRRQLQQGKEKSAA